MVTKNIYNKNAITSPTTPKNIEVDRMERNAENLSSPFMKQEIEVSETVLGIVKKQLFKFVTDGEDYALESGEKLSPITVSYETYGQMNQDASNCILVLHALSGDSHAAGLSSTDQRTGWWNGMIGPGKALDTRKYFIICSNVIGGCRGSTGPSSIDPSTDRPFGVGFPTITISDMVNVQKGLIEYLGISKLLSVVGGSMGGMQVLQWLKSYPESVVSAVPIATTLKHTAMQIALDEVGRQSIMADPNWNNGDYYGVETPKNGLSVARMLGHITYMSNASMSKKFGRNVSKSMNGEKLSPEFEVERYLKYKGKNFVNRFDANSYLYLTKAMDNFDLSDKRRTFNDSSLKEKRMLIISFESDWLYPSWQSRDILQSCQSAGANAAHVEIESDYGHDAFLLELEKESLVIKDFLEAVALKNGIDSSTNQSL